MFDIVATALAYSGGWQDIAIAGGMLVFIGSVAGMILDDRTTVSPIKAFAYGTAQLTVAIANASLGLWVSAGLLVIGSGLWYTLGYQSCSVTGAVGRRNADGRVTPSDGAK